MNHQGNSSENITGRRWFNARFIMLLVVLTAGISASVIGTDIIARRDRHPIPATEPAK